MKIHHLQFYLSILAPFLVTLSAYGEQVDLNENGLDDLWEQTYATGDLTLEGDADSDGKTNAEEERAGTDPLDRDSKLVVAKTTTSDGSATVTFVSVPGKRYRLLGGLQPDGSDFTELGIQDATDAAGSITAAAPSAELGFFSLTAEDLDSDGDGLSDWAEFQLQHEGYDPNNTNSRNLTINDRDFFIQSLETSTGAFRFHVAQMTAFEIGPNGIPTPRSLKVSRIGGIAPITVFYSINGSTNPDNEAATEADYEALTGILSFAEGQTISHIQILPVADGIHEFPHSMEVSLDTHPDYMIGLQQAVDVTIFDAINDPSNTTYFLGQFNPELGAESTASGYSWIKLNGQKDIALVTMQFSGLTTEQTAAHIHHSSVEEGSISNGPVVESLPLGQFVDRVWSIRRTGPYAPQDFIDAFFGQNGQSPLYANAHSMDFPSGEIWAFYTENNGSITFEVPEDPPAIEVLAGDDLTRDVQRFLTQATFGPRQEEIEALVDDINTNHGGDRIAGFGAWVDAQFALDQTNFRDVTFAADAQEWALSGGDPKNPGDPAPGSANRHSAFWHIAMNAHDQLRQRAGFALSEIFVVSGEDDVVEAFHYGTANYYDMLLNHTDGRFVTLLRKVSRHPIMGNYLSSLKNSKAVYNTAGKIVVSPDENYAREVMQLLSIGLVTLHPDGSTLLDPDGFPIPTYDNDTVIEMAKVFTGWSFSKKNNGDFAVVDNNNFTLGNGQEYFQAPWENPMKPFLAHRDVGEKSILGYVLPAGQNGYQDLIDATSILATHGNAAPFMAKRLIQRLVTSNPSPGYIYRVANAFSSNANQGNQMQHVFKAILLDHEARSLTHVDQPGYGKLKEPLLRYVQLLRAMDAKTGLPLSMLEEYGYPASQLDNFPVDAPMFRLTTQGHNYWQQSHLQAPTVFNWFQPEYKVSGDLLEAGLVAPEFTLVNEPLTIKSINHYRSLIFSTNGIGARELPDQELIPSLDARSDNYKIYDSIEAFADQFAADVASGDTAEVAATTLVDHLDVLLCAGGLKANYGADTSGVNPRNSIIAQVVYSFSPTDEALRRTAVRDALYLMANSPAYITQK